MIAKPEKVPSKADIEINFLLDDEFPLAAAELFVYCNRRDGTIKILGQTWFFVTRNQRMLQTFELHKDGIPLGSVGTALALDTICTELTQIFEALSQSQILEVG